MSSYNSILSMLEEDGVQGGPRTQEDSAGVLQSQGPESSAPMASTNSAGVRPFSGNPLSSYNSILSMLEEDTRQQEQVPATPADSPDDRGFLGSVWSGARSGLTSARAGFNFLTGDYAELAELSKELEQNQFRPSTATVNFLSGDGSFWDAPLQITAEIIGQAAASSLLPMATGAAGAFTGSAIPGVGTAAGAYVGGAIGLGLGSGVVEGAAKYLDALQDAGVDLTDESAIIQAMRDPAITNVARDKAVAKGLTVGAFDAATALLTGALLGRIFKSVRSVVTGASAAESAAATAGAGAAETTGTALASAAVEAAGGMGGEYFGEKAAGDEPTTGNVLAEGIGELVFGAPKVLVTYAQPRIARIIDAHAERILKGDVRQERPDAQGEAATNQEPQGIVVEDTGEDQGVGGPSQREGVESLARGLAEIDSPQPIVTDADLSSLNENQARFVTRWANAIRRYAGQDNPSDGDLDALDATVRTGKQKAATLLVPRNLIASIEERAQELALYASTPYSELAVNIASRAKARIWSSRSQAQVDAAVQAAEKRLDSLITEAQGSGASDATIATLHAVRKEVTEFVAKTEESSREQARREDDARAEVSNKISDLGAEAQRQVGDVAAMEIEKSRRDGQIREWEGQTGRDVGEVWVNATPPSIESAAQAVVDARRQIDQAADNTGSAIEVAQIAEEARRDLTEQGEPESGDAIYDYAMMRVSEMPVAPPSDVIPIRARPSEPVAPESKSVGRPNVPAPGQFAPIGARNWRQQQQTTISDDPEVANTPAISDPDTVQQEEVVDNPPDKVAPQEPSVQAEPEQGARAPDSAVEAPATTEESLSTLKEVQAALKKANSVESLVSTLRSAMQSGVVKSKSAINGTIRLAAKVHLALHTSQTMADAENVKVRPQTLASLATSIDKTFDSTPLNPGEKGYPGRVVDKIAEMLKASPPSETTVESQPEAAIEQPADTSPADQNDTTADDVSPDYEDPIQVGVGPRRVRRITTPTKKKIEYRWRVVDVGDIVNSFDKAYDQRLQPRDRDRAASKLQIDRILNDPIPDWLGPSPHINSGAPIVGPDMMVETGNGRSEGIRRLYAGTSSSNRSAANNYRNWLMGDPPPLRENFETQEQYTEAMIDYQDTGVGVLRDLGFSAEDIQAVEQMDGPILVRVRQTPMSAEERIDFTEEGNRETGSSSSDTEVATSDARKITPGVFALLNPDADIDKPQNMDFAAAVLGAVATPDEYQKLVESDGSKPSNQGYTRVKNALLMYAYRDEGLIRDLSEGESDDPMRNISNGIRDAAGKIGSVIAKIEAGIIPEIGLTSDIVDAAGEIRRIRENKAKDSSNPTVEEYMQTYSKENTMFAVGPSDNVFRVMEMFQDLKGSKKKVADLLGTYAEIIDGVYALSGPRNQATMFANQIEIDTNTAMDYAHKVVKGQVTVSNVIDFIRAENPDPLMGAAIPAQDTGGQESLFDANTSPEASQGSTQDTGERGRPMRRRGQGPFVGTTSNIPESAQPDVTTKPKRFSPVLESIRGIVSSLGLGAVIRVGGKTPLGRSKAEITIMNEGVVRLDDAADIPAALHGISHLVYATLFSGDRVVEGGVKALPEKELTAMGQRLYSQSDGPPPGGWAQEGFAEFLSKYVAGFREQLQKEAPQMLRLFEDNVLKKEPFFALAIEKANKQYSEFYGQSPLSMARGKVVVPSRIKTITQWAKRNLTLKAIAVAWMDSGWALNGISKWMLDQHIAEHERIQAEEGPRAAKAYFDEHLRRDGKEVKLRYSNDVFAFHAAVQGTSSNIVHTAKSVGWKTKEGVVLSDGFDRYIAPCKGPGVLDSLRAYLVARGIVTYNKMHATPDGPQKFSVTDLEMAESVVSELGGMAIPGSSMTYEESARGISDWNKGALRYMASEMESLGVVGEPYVQNAQRVLDAYSGDNLYIPMFRQVDNLDKNRIINILDSAEDKSGNAGPGAGLFRRIAGKGRDIHDPLSSSLVHAASLVENAHHNTVTGMIVRYYKPLQVGGLNPTGSHAWGVEESGDVGQFIRKIDPSRINGFVSVESIVNSLKASGVDVSVAPDVDLDTIVKIWMEQSVHETEDGNPVVAWPENDGSMAYYEIDSDIYDAIYNMEPSKTHWLFDLLLAMPTRALRLTTTGLRAGFSFQTNPVRDFLTWIFQTQNDKNVFEMTQRWAMSMREAFAKNPKDKILAHHKDLSKTLGLNASTLVGQDRQSAKKHIYDTSVSPEIRFVNNPILFLTEPVRDLFGRPEEATRLAEMSLYAEKMGYKQNKDGTWPEMTRDHIIGMSLAYKQATVDFSSMGSIGKTVNMMIPFFNSAIQGSRSFARAIRSKRRQGGKRWNQFWIRAATLGGLTLSLWLSNRDEEWYKEANPSTKYLYWLIKSPFSDRVFAIPRPFEWGNMVSVVPEALVNFAYDKDPDGFMAAMDHIWDTTVPMDWPVLVKLIIEQLSNEVAFFESNIVPPQEEFVPPEEQAGKYTSSAAKAIARAMPGFMPDAFRSPRRVDHAIRTVFGGAGYDIAKLPNKGRAVLEMIGILEESSASSDYSEVMPFMRSGGVETLGSRSVKKFYNDYRVLQQLRGSRQRSLTDEQEEYYQRLVRARGVLTALRNQQNAATSLDARNEASRRIRQAAREVVANAPEVDYAEMESAPDILSVQRNTDKSIRDARSLVRSRIDRMLSRRYGDRPVPDEMRQRFESRDPIGRQVTRLSRMANTAAERGSAERLRRINSMVEQIIEREVERR